jgi:hypothetical protein
MEYQTLLGQFASRYRLLSQPEQFAENGPTTAPNAFDDNPYRQAQYAAQYPPQPGDAYQGYGPQPPAGQWGGQAGGSYNGGAFAGQPGGNWNAGAYGQNDGPAYGGGYAGQPPAGAYGPQGESQPWPQQQPTNWNAQPAAAAPPPSQVIDNPYQSSGGVPPGANYDPLAQRQPFAPPAGYGPPSSFAAPPAGPPPQYAGPPPGSPGSQPPAAAEHPPVALDGYCPVTVVEGNAWRKGDPRYGAVHRGRTYLFTGPEQQRQFLSRPDYYSPVFSGFDPVRYVETGQLVDGKRNFGVFYDTMYLFADEAGRARFESDPQRYSGAIRQAMSQYGLPQRR